MFITSFEEQSITYRSCSNFRIHLYTSRYAIGISTIESEEAQKVCKGNATKIGTDAYDSLSDKYKTLFKNQVAVDLTYESIKSADQVDENNNTVKKSSLYDSAPYVNSDLKAHAKFK